MAAIPPPAVTDQTANDALNDAYQGGNQNALVRVGKSSKRKNTAEILNTNNKITEQELGQQEVFHLQQVTSALPPGAALPGAPAWFGPAMAAAMAAALAPINATLNNHTALLNNHTVLLNNHTVLLNNHTALLNDIDGRLNNIEARQVNSTVQSQTDALQPIRNAAGNIAPNFPATFQGI